MTRTPRLASALVAGALALGLTVAGSATASARPSKAGDWLEKQLTHGLIHNKVYDYDDYGLTADTGVALKTVGGHHRAVKQIKRALAAHVDSWTTGVDFGSSDVYAGSVAKALAFAQTTGAKPRAFGGVDLVERLEGLVSSDPGIAGRIQDRTADTDYANTLGQAYAAAGLSRAKSDRAASVVRFLLAQQCDAGFFRLYFADAAATDQTCDGAPRKDRAPDTDATAIAVLNLQSITKPSRAVKRSIASGLTWLVRHQEKNGSFGGGVSTKASNSNSTGLAAWTLARGGRCRAADNASDWLATLQKRNGAIAYDRAAFRAGIDGQSLDQWRRATSQAAAGLKLPGC